jgi:hypothetical protein
MGRTVKTRRSEERESRLVFSEAFVVGVYPSPVRLHSRLQRQARRGLTHSCALAYVLHARASPPGIQPTLAAAGRQTRTHRALHRAFGTRTGDFLSVPTPPPSLIAFRTSPRAAKADCSYILAQRCTAARNAGFQSAVAVARTEDSSAGTAAEKHCAF